MVTVGVNKEGTITIAGKSTEEPIEREGCVTIEPVAAIKLRSIEEAGELITQLLFAIRKQAFEEGFNEGIKFGRGRG